MSGKRSVIKKLSQISNTNMIIMEVNDKVGKWIYVWIESRVKEELYEK